MLVNDATLLLRDIAGDAATKAATKVKPSQEQLRHIDEPAEEGVWHDAPDISVDKLKGRFKTTKPTGAEGEAGAEAGTTKRRLSDMVSKDTYEQARINRERTQDYLAGKVPQERRDQTIWRLRKMVVEIQSHPDCRCPTHVSLLNRMLIDFTPRCAGYRHTPLLGRDLLRSCANHWTEVHWRSPGRP